ncbi:hypothetical protein TorRG33x02_239560, partial [Trema orientale]
MYHKRGGFSLPRPAPIKSSVGRCPAPHGAPFIAGQACPALPEIFVPEIFAIPNWAYS